MPCENVEGLEGAFARGSLDEVLKNLPGLGLLLILIFPHVSGAAWSSGVEQMEEDTMKYQGNVSPAKAGGDR